MEPYHAAQAQPLQVVPPADAADPLPDPADPLVAAAAPAVGETLEALAARAPGGRRSTPRSTPTWAARATIAWATSPGTATATAATGR
jgi:hypothetical protein